MATHKRADVERELFPAGDEDKVSALEGQLRAEIRAYELAGFRKAGHLAQRRVAREMGVTTARVSQIEHGQAGRAAIRGLAGYAEALGGHLELAAGFGGQRCHGLTGAGRAAPVRRSASAHRRAPAAASRARRGGRAVTVGPTSPNRPPGP
jgi:transcriptional regulator with XRE-family HTH domain